MTVMNEANAQTADRAAGATDPYRRTGRSCSGSTGFHITVFEPSYQEPDGWSGQEHDWLWTTGESAKQSNRIVTVNASIDLAAITPGKAPLMGAIIGFERQWRQRMAGLRTKPVVE
jgi:hypothetical protein